MLLEVDAWLCRGDVGRLGALGLLRDFKLNALAGGKADVPFHLHILKLQTRKWQDKSGNDRYTTEVVAQEMQLLGGRGERRQAESKPAAAGDDFGDSEIPF